jgi:AraC-like DNA-binding protein
MIFEYSFLNVNHILEKFSDAIQVPVTDDKVIYTEKLGSGYLKKVLLPSGIQYLIFEYNYKTDLLVQHIANLEEQYMLWFDVSYSLQPLVLQDDKTITKFENVFNMSAAFICSYFSFSHLRTKDSNGYGVAIILHKKILQNFIAHNDWTTVLQWYFDLKLKGLSLLKITEVERNKVESIVSLTSKRYPYITLEKNIYQLLELFFLRLDRLYQETANIPRLTSTEVDVLKNVENIIKEHYLTDSFDVKKLEKQIGMSKYNLEKLVKKAFAKTLVDYIKQYKMQIAYQEVIHSDKDIKEIAFEVGYANPSNFSSAFKKRFGHKPSEIR